VAETKIQAILHTHPSHAEKRSFFDIAKGLRVEKDDITKKKKR